MTRALRVARQTAVKARTQAVNAIKALLVTAPVELRERLDGLPTTRLVRQAAALDPGDMNTPTAAYMVAVGSLAERYQQLGAEILALTSELDRLTLRHAPALRALLGVGPEVAAELLVCAGATRPGWGRRPRSRRCVAPPQWRPPRARPAGIA